MVYKTVAGSLFPQTPSYTDEVPRRTGRLLFHLLAGHDRRQQPGGRSRTCSSTTATAPIPSASTPAPTAVLQLHNGSYQRRLHQRPGTADYVTVNSICRRAQRHAGLRRLRRQPSNASNALWIPLAEKAYAQWNQTGKEGATAPTPISRSRAAGWPRSTPRCSATTPPTTALTTAERADHHQRPDQPRGGDDRHRGSTTPTPCLRPVRLARLRRHRLQRSSGMFTLYNPWGFDQPGQLTSSQLNSDCSGFVATNAAGATPISGGVQESGKIGYFFASAAPASDPAALSTSPTMPVRSPWRLISTPTRPPRPTGRNAGPRREGREAIRPSSAAASLSGLANARLANADAVLGDGALFDAGASNPLASLAGDDFDFGGAAADLKRGAGRRVLLPAWLDRRSTSHGAGRLIECGQVGPLCGPISRCKRHLVRTADPTWLAPFRQFFECGEQ